MATKGKGATPSRKTSIPVGNFPVPPIPMDANRSGKQDWESVVGWIAACVLLALMLPLGAMLYIDILEAKNETKRALQKLEKIEQRIERKQRDKDRKEPDAIGDNPVFDRRIKPNGYKYRIDI